MGSIVYLLSTASEFEGTDKQVLIAYVEKFFEIEEQEHTATERSITNKKKKFNIQDQSQSLANLTKEKVDKIIQYQHLELLRSEFEELLLRFFQKKHKELNSSKESEVKSKLKKLLFKLGQVPA